MQDHIYAIDRDPDGTLVLSRVRLATPNGGVTVGPTGGQFALSQSFATGLRGSLQRLEAMCVGSGGASGFGSGAGAWNIRDASGGSILITLSQGKNFAPAGERYIWEYPTPVQSPQSTGNFANQLHVEVVGTNMGVWYFTANGYQTQAGQGGSTF